MVVIVVCMRASRTWYRVVSIEKSAIRVKNYNGVEGAFSIRPWAAISIGVTLAWAIEVFQNGFINTKYTDGLVLNFGDSETLYKALNKVASQTNEFYKDLEKGVYYCSNKYGGSEFAIHFGKNEAPGYMTGLYAYLGYATGIRHSHLDSAGYSIDQKNLVELKELNECIKDLYKEAIWRNILNSLVICLFARNIYTPELILEALEAIDLNNWNFDKLQTLAKTIHTEKIKFKQKCGFTFEELKLPKKLSKVVSGNTIVTEELFVKALDIYKNLVYNDMQNA